MWKHLFAEIQEELKKTPVNTAKIEQLREEIKILSRLPSQEESHSGFDYHESKEK